MKTIKWIALFAWLSTASVSHALDVNAYEKYKKQAQGDGVEAIMAKTLLLGYFSGVSEQINFMYQGGMPLSQDGRQIVCVPKSVTFYPDMLQAIADAELRNPKDLIALLGPTWKEYTVAGTLVFRGLLRNYPC